MDCFPAHFPESRALQTRPAYGLVQERGKHLHCQSVANGRYRPSWYMRSLPMGPIAFMHVPGLGRIPCSYSFFRQRKRFFPDCPGICEHDRAIIFWEFLSRFSLLSSLSLPVSGDPRGCHDPHQEPVRAVGYEGCAVGGAMVFSVDDGEGEDGGGPGGGVCPHPCAGPCQDLPVTPCGLCDHAVSDVVRVLVP